MKNSLADIVASNMQKIVNSDSHKKMFKKETAKKQCCDCVKCGAKCSCKKKCKNCKDCCAKPKKQVKPDKSLKHQAKQKAVKKAAEQIISLLLKISETQDNIGFVKGAELTSILISKTIRDFNKLAAEYSSDYIADEIIEQLGLNVPDDTEWREVGSEGADSSAPLSTDEGVPVVEELVSDPNADTIRADELAPETDVEGLGENETDTFIEATKPSTIADQPNTIKPEPGDDIIFPKYIKPLTEDDFNLAANSIVKALLKVSELQDNIGLTSASVMAAKIAESIVDDGPVSMRGQELSSVENEGKPSDDLTDTETPSELRAKFKLDAINEYESGTIDLRELKARIRKIDDMYNDLREAREADRGVDDLGNQIILQEAVPETLRTGDIGGIDGNVEDYIDTLPADDFTFAMSQLDQIIKQAHDEEDELEDELPPDYEPCRDCGYDHIYEPKQAAEAHDIAERELADRLKRDINSAKGPRNKSVEDLVGGFPATVNRFNKMNQRAREKSRFDLEGGDDASDIIAGEATEPDELCPECLGLDSEDCQSCSGDMNDAKLSVLSGPYKSWRDISDPKDSFIYDPVSYIEPDESNLCVLCGKKIFGDDKRSVSLCNDCMD